jgi:hypothetical protein
MRTAPGAAHAGATYGLHFKMTHDDPRPLYLIGHASLEKRGPGLSIGQANIYQMLAPEHRLSLGRISPFHYHSCWLM